MNKTRKFTFKNDFHNSEVTVIGKLCANNRGYRGYKISHAQYKKVNNNLCGISDCICGGIRGRQDFGHEWHADFIYLYDFENN